MLYLLHQTLTRAAERDSDHVAVRCRDVSLTYGELELRTNALARVLLDHGVRRGDRVGILARKSVELAVAVHGIMKAGAAYVPLDPSAPPARQRHIIRDCGIRHMVTREQSAKAVIAIDESDGPLTCCVGLEPDRIERIECVPWRAVLEVRPESPARGTTEQDLAYVLYTSGSTGEPKGIMHTHRSALAFAEVAASTYGFGPSDRLTNHAPLHFDLSTLDYFAAAVAGATTVIVPEEHTKLPASLSELLQRERVTVFYAVPLAMIQLVLHGALERRDLGALRWVLFGGEPFPPKHLRKLMALVPGARYANIYGPTETNGCTHYLVPPLARDDDEPLPIGSVYDNVETLVVDEKDNDVGVGESGELLVRSGTRMLGYWGRPELTEQATYARPSYAGSVDLFHRTGDIVERRTDGSFRLLGRRDRQIKTRGHRVELDEIEAVLASHPAVEEAAAFAVPDGDGSLEIRAAVLLIAGETASSADLSKHVRGELPPYAVPSRIDVLDELPRTGTGKIDRRGLQTRAMNATDAARSD